MPKGKSSASDPAVLAMALVGYELEKQRIDDRIRQIRAQLGGRSGTGGTMSAGPAKATGTRRRTLSAAARRRIAAAQRKRWAEHRKKVARAGKG